MKPLDEVIKGMECCYIHQEEPNCSECPYKCKEKYGLCGDQKLDALHYLKEYRDRKETLRNWTEKAISEQQNLSDAITFMQAYRDDKDDLTALRAYWKEQHENNALTWEELKQMEGKPVWVEIGDGSRGWVIIRKITDTGIVSGSDGFIGIATAYGMDTTWQAYRKERADV